MESRICKKCTICGVRRLPKSSISLAKFPLDPDRCRLWVKASGIEDLVYVPIEKLHQLKYICGAHFTRQCFNAKGNRLLASAVPTEGLMRTPLSDDLFTEFPLHIKSYYDKIRYLLTFLSKLFIRKFCKIFNNEFVKSEIDVADKIKRAQQQNKDH